MDAKIVLRPKGDTLALDREFVRLIAAGFVDAHERVVDCLDYLIGIGQATDIFASDEYQKLVEMRSIYKERFDEKLRATVLRHGRGPVPKIKRLTIVRRRNARKRK